MKKYICTVCGYLYDPAEGVPENDIEPGIAFEDLPDDWVCPVCGVDKDLFEEENLLDQLQGKIEHFAKRLESFKDLEPVGDIRQCGFMVGIELVADRKTKEPYPVKNRMGHQVIIEARKRGLIIRPLSDVVVLMPPLAVSIDELDRLCDITYESIWVACSKVS